MNPKIKLHSQKLAFGLFLSLFMAIGSGQMSWAQSTDASRPTVVRGSSIKATLVDNVEPGYATYYYSVRLNAGATKATLKAQFAQCGGSVSVYVDGQPNVSTLQCDSATNIGTGELDFVVPQTKNVLVTIYVAGSPNERVKINLGFMGNRRDAQPRQLGSAKVCTYSDNFSLSDANPAYEKLYPGLIFKQGTAQMSITAINNEGSNLSGSVYAEQTDRGQNNENLVLPAAGFGGTIVTPMNNESFAAVPITGNGRGGIRVQLGQNGNGEPKTGRYQVVVRGSAIVSCGSGNRL